jgi:GNAT superfamily N-acetyltransferase
MQIERKNVVFRRARVGDIADLVDYRIRFLNEQYSHQEDDRTRTVRRSLLEYLAKAIPSGDFIAWVAEYNGRIVATSGMVVWQIPARYGGIESGRLGYVLNFYTIPEARREGIGTGLLEELIKEARFLGIKYLHLHASEDGIGIYRKAGFVEPSQPELVLKLE